MNSNRQHKWLSVLGAMAMQIGGCGDAEQTPEPAQQGVAGDNSHVLAPGAVGATASDALGSAGAGGANAAAGAAASSPGGAGGASAGGAGRTRGAPQLTAGSAEMRGAAGMFGTAGTNSDGAGGRSNATAGNGAAGQGAPITLWIAGDSTVARGETPCPVGWGAAFASHFTSSVKIVNSAVGGRSVRTWLYDVGTTLDNNGECTLARDARGEPTVQARWQAMLDGMKTGDFLFIQFGINDSSRTCDRHVGVDAFKTTYGSMAQAAKDRGAQPIFVTPVSAIACTGNMAHGTRDDYVSATIAAGMTYAVPVIELHQLSIAFYNSQRFCPLAGGDISASTGGAVGDFFCDDHTHFSEAGAAQIANLVAMAVRDQKLIASVYLK